MVGIKYTSVNVLALSRFSFAVFVENKNNNKKAADKSKAVRRNKKRENVSQRK